MFDKAGRITFHSHSGDVLAMINVQEQTAADKELRELPFTSISSAHGLQP